MKRCFFVSLNSDSVYQQSALSSFSIMLVAIWFMVTRFFIRILCIVLRGGKRERERDRKREIARERERGRERAR